MGYILGNGYSLHTRPPLYTLYVVPYYIPSTWFLTIYPSHETPNPRPQLYTLTQVPYCESLTSVYISIEKSVIN